MKKYILFFLLPFFLLACKNETNTPTNSDEYIGDKYVPSELRAAFNENAIRLALTHMEKTAKLELLPIDVPSDTIKIFYYALVDVYNARTLLEREISPDTMQLILSIRVWIWRALNNFFASVDTTFPWTTSWKEGQPLTGYPQIDNLIQQYEISLRQFMYTQNGKKNMVDFYTKRPLNLAALCYDFTQIPGVISASPNHLYTTGDPYPVIQASILPAYIELKYFFPNSRNSLGHQWIFRVWKNHTVLYVR